ncbi:uncharacterized protein [Haliotis cracherodii]|uniref:uncharacterized protein n=2 Tax=Haliotis cracherodii TaxID=6455 RepID=UPI0039EA9C0A
MGSNRPHTSPISPFLTENQPARQVNSMAPSPVDLNEMAPWLRQYARVNYRDANYLWVGFSFGFKLEFQGSRTGRLARNLRSATHQDTAGYVKQKLQKEVDLGRMAGPFKDTPLDNLQVSPIGLVPKKQPGYGQHLGKHAEEFRLIHHLSYPRGKSINDFIDTEACSVVYARFDEATQMVQQLGKGALLAKFDIQSAFRIIPVHPSDFELLGIRFEGEFYFDKCLPFGCSISCAIFETFSTFLQWCMQSHLPTCPVMHYLDDFLTGGTAGTSHCSDNLNGCVNTLEQLGVPIAHDKTVGPTTKLTFLGLKIDTIAMQIRIPEPKIKEATREIQDILSTGNIKVTKRALQSLIGKLNFMCRAIPMARAFSRRLIDLLSKGKQPFHHIRITSWVKEDLQMWLTFLTSYNGISVFQDQLWVDIWMVGSSYMARARQYLLLKGTSPNQPRMLWLARGGMRWKELDTILDAQVKATRRSPRALIIHLGSNDLCSVKGSQLYLDMVASILRIQLQLPDTKIIVSSMLPRRYWHDARDPRKIEGMRKNINRRLTNRVKELGGTTVPHPQILASDKTWYAWEGVHLSDKGLCVFTDNLLHALALVLRQ